MDTKLVLFTALLALTEAFTPLSFGYASVEFASRPSTPALLLVAGVVKLLLLLLPSLHRDHSLNHDSITYKQRQKPAKQQQHERQDSPVKGKDQSELQCPKLNQDSSSCLILDVQQFDKQQPVVEGLLHKQHNSTGQPGRSPQQATTQAPSAGAGSYNRKPTINFWQLVLVSAVCSTVASNIMLSLLPNMAPYAWTQLALLQVVAMACFACSSGSSGSGSGSGSKLRTNASATVQAALGVLFLAVCVGQGVFGGQPVAAASGPEEAHFLQAAHGAMPAHMQLGPCSILGWGVLAAVLSTLSARLLLLAQHAGKAQNGPSYQGLSIAQCMLVIACNFLWFCAKEGEFDSMFDEFMPPHWHAALLLGVSSLLSTAVSYWPAAEELAAKAYAYQGAVVLAAWGSNLLLDAPQGVLFACSSFLAGSMVLLLHHGMHADASTHHSKGQQDLTPSLWQRSCTACHAELKARRVNWRALRDTLSCFWAALTLLLLALTCWVQLVQNVSLDRFSFTHPASTQAMANLGITPEGLNACSDAPFPVTQLYYSSIMAAQRAVAASLPGNVAPGTTGAAAIGTAQASSLHLKAAAADAPVPAWELCPGLTCSRDPSCTSDNTTCCVHLFVQMAAFWDAFMHSNGLSRQYTVLYNTLAEALDTGGPSADVGVMHVGVSAQAMAVLERPCLKTKLWQHGYALFLQGNSWHMCAHRQHPSPLFRQHMHPVRHLTPNLGAGSMKLHVMFAPTTQNLHDAHLSTAPVQGLQDSQGASGSATRQAVQPVGMRRMHGKAATTWRLCSTGELLSTAASIHASIDGLRVPRPLGAELSTNNSSWASPEGAHPAVSSRVERECDRLVAELLAHLEV